MFLFFVHCTDISGSGEMPISKFSVDIVKGWTRATCVVFIMLAVTELDPSEESTKALVKPLGRVLDKAWLLPMHAPGPEYVVWGCCGLAGREAILTFFWSGGYRWFVSVPLYVS